MKQLTAINGLFEVIEIFEIEKFLRDLSLVLQVS